MNSPVIQDFALSLPLDNNLLHADVIAGTPIDTTEILSLAAMANSLFISACHESRSIDSVDARREFWAGIARLFTELCDSWAGVEAREPSIGWLRRRLEHYRSLCEDRRGLYLITESDRREHAKCKESEMRSANVAEEPQPFSPREISHINAAFNRRLTAGKSF